MHKCLRCGSVLTQHEYEIAMEDQFFIPLCVSCAKKFLAQLMAALAKRNRYETGE